MEIFKDNALAYADLISSIINSFKEIILNILGINIYDANIVTTGIESAALSLAGLFLAMEMISMISEFRFERIEDAIRLWIKLLFAKIIIENSSNIIGSIYDLFKGLGVVSIDDGFSKISGSIGNITEAAIAPNKGLLGEGYIFSCIVLLIVTLVVSALLIMLTIEIMGIVFEIGIHQAIGPIAISTLCNSTARSTGIAFIKSYAAVCLQTTVIGAIFTVYVKFADDFIVSDLSEKIAGVGAFGIMFRFLSPVLSLAVLCITVKKSDDLTKRMFGA